MGMDPVTIGLIISAVAGGFSAITQMEAADNAQATSENNAELLRRDGEVQKDAAVAQAEKIRRAAKYQVGAANAANAASGVAIGEGSALRINEQILKDSESDAYNTILTGTRRQRSSNNESMLTLQAGDNAKSAGYMSAGSTLLSTGATMAKGWQTPKTLAPVVERSSYSTGS